MRIRSCIIANDVPTYSLRYDNGDREEKAPPADSTFPMKTWLWPGMPSHFADAVVAACAKGIYFIRPNVISILDDSMLVLRA